MLGDIASQSGKPGSSKGASNVVEPPVSPGGRNSSGVDLLDFDGSKSHSPHELGCHAPSNSVFLTSISSAKGGGHGRADAWAVVPNVDL